MFVNFLNRSMPCVALLSAMFMLAGVASADHITGITIASSTLVAVSAVPEPTSAALFALAAISLFARRRRPRR